MKVTVLCITWKPGYIDSMVYALKRQTLAREDFEFLLVDDLYEVRKGVVRAFVGDSLNFRHIPPREIKPFSATATAVNTGLEQAKGELVYFMADYCHPHPECLARHWEIYLKHGPKVFISGPLIDGITSQGKSIWQGAPAEVITVKVGEEDITYPEHTPPIKLRLKPNFTEPVPENLISIFERPFEPTWPKHLATDWRMGAICEKSIAPYIFETTDNKWWWAGRNDSAPLEMLRAVGGLREAGEEVHGGLEVEMSEKMMKLGCRYLVDREAPCYILPHPTRKPERRLS